ncbi:MAG: iron ABC transporter permease [Pseudomonadota bacterium]
MLSKTIIDLRRGSSLLRRTNTGDRAALARGVIVCLLVFLLFSIVFALSIGPTSLSIVDLANYLGSLVGLSDIGSRDRLILESIRFPRVAMGILVGAALAVSGAVMQGLFRNPLADPGIIGVSAGASLGAVSIIVLGATVLQPLVTAFGVFALPMAAFCGALSVTLVLYGLSTRGGSTSIATLLLGGIALGAFAAALTGVFVYIADDAQLRDLTFWSLGSLAGATWAKTYSITPVVIATVLLSPFLARGLDAIAMGEATAHHVGISVQSFKRVAIVGVAAATGAAVAVSGGIGFVGIIVPHLLRLIMGPNNRHLLIASALLGASLLLFCDTISRVIVAPSELPIGIVTALIGSPFFMWILLSRRGLAR